MFKKYFRKCLPPPARNPNYTRALREWSIGIYFGTSPLEFTPPPNIRNPVITRRHFSHIDADLVADPFMIWFGRRWYMFMEVVNGRTGLGEIGVAESRDGCDWRSCRIVLREPFHLSYPYVFEWRNEYYMIPETRQANSVRLYKASRFPTKWKLIGDLLQGHGYVDSSIFYANDHWWLLTAGGQSSSGADTLFLFHSEQLTGPWVQHPKSPLLVEAQGCARPAGRVFVRAGEIYRYGQDCSREYGLQVRGFKILELTVSEYKEEEVMESPILHGSGLGWNAGGMHHIDPHVSDDGNFVACVDGWFWRKHIRSSRWSQSVS